MINRSMWRRTISFRKSRKRGAPRGPFGYLKSVAEYHALSQTVRSIAERFAFGSMQRERDVLNWGAEKSVTGGLDISCQLHHSAATVIGQRRRSVT